MKKRYIAILTAMFIFLVTAEGSAWKKLEYIEMQDGKTYHLQDNVSVLEFRNYKKPYKASSFRPDITIEVKKVSEKEMKTFRRAAPNFSRKSNIAYPPKYKGDTSRAFVLYSDGKISRMNEIADVLKLMGTIDTPEEAQLVLWMHSQYRKKAKKTLKGSKVNSVTVTEEKARKVSNGYEFISKYTLYATKKGSEEEGESYSFSIQLFQVVTVKSLVSKDGKIKSYKIISRSKIGEEESMLTSCANVM